MTAIIGETGIGKTTLLFITHRTTCNTLYDDVVALCQN